MNASVVADGWDRLREVTCAERVACRKAVMAELQERYRPQLERAGFFRRHFLQSRMRREAEAMVRKRLALPSRGALFLATLFRRD